MGSKNGIKFAALSVALLCAFILSVWQGGSENIVLNNLQNDFIFWQIRLPKSLTAVFAGSALAVSGLVLQVLFRNPLAGPYVLGISSGASLMVAISMLAGGVFGVAVDSLPGRSVTVVAAISGSLAVTFLILAVAQKVSSNVVLLIIGILFSQICGAIESALQYFADAGNVKTFVLWGMGSLGSTTPGDLQIFAPVVLLCLVCTVTLIKPLNALLLGQNYAQNAGVNFNRSRFRLILLSSVFTGVTTAFCGPLAFVGIAVPVLSRMLFNTSRQEVHLLACALIGSTLLLVADVLCHSLTSDFTLPINMITTFIGAPLVICLLFKTKTW